MGELRVPLCQISRWAPTSFTALRRRLSNAAATHPKPVRKEEKNYVFLTRKANAQWGAGAFVPARQEACGTAKFRRASSPEGPDQVPPQLPADRWYRGSVSL